MKKILSVFKENPATLLLCILTAFFSAPGQTYILSLYVPWLRTDFGLNQTAVASFFSICTLLAGTLQPLYGITLDKRSIRFYVTGGALLFSIGCFMLGLAHSYWTLGIALVILRAMGQGAFTLFPNTVSLRGFHKNRSTAFSIKSLGAPLSEAISPLVVSSLILKFGWRISAIVTGLALMLIYLPLALGLTTKIKAPDLKISELTHVANSQKKGLSFYLLLIGALGVPLVCTGLFFHQILLSELKGWNGSTMPLAFGVYGISRGATSFFIGPIVDRVGAKALFPYHLIVLIVAIFALNQISSSIAALVFFVLAGLSVGLAGNIVSSMWVEIYGTKSAGFFNGILGAAVVFSTASAPPLFALLLENGIELNNLLNLSIGIIVFCIFSGRLGIRLAK